MIGAELAVSAFAAIVMLIGALFSRLFPLLRNFQRTYLFGAAAAGVVFIVALITLGVLNLLGSA